MESITSHFRFNGWSKWKHLDDRTLGFFQKHYNKLLSPPTHTGNHTEIKSEKGGSNRPLFSENGRSWDLYNRCSELRDSVTPSSMSSLHSISWTGRHNTTRGRGYDTEGTVREDFPTDPREPGTEINHFLGQRWGTGSNGMGMSCSPRSRR